MFVPNHTVQILVPGYIMIFLILPSILLFPNMFMNPILSRCETEYILVDEV